MKSSSRWLLIFGVAVSVLVVVTVALVLFTRDSASLLPEDTPQGTTQRFLMAVQDEDFQKAYSYLSLYEQEKEMPYDGWVNNPMFRSSQSTWKATLSDTRLTGDEATVEVNIDVFRPGGPFEDPVRRHLVFFQLKKVDNSWFITSPPNLYWLY